MNNNIDSKSNIIIEETICSICLDDFNNSNRKKIECPSGCVDQYCVKCFKECLIRSHFSNPKCPSCQMKLSLQFVAQVTPKIFHNGVYREKRAKDLLSKERSLLPATQLLIISKSERKRRDKRIKQIEMSVLYIDEQFRKLTKEIERLSKLKWKLLNESSELCSSLIDDSEKTETKDKERKCFIMGCTVEECKGFLSQAWKCGLCETFICSKCRKPKKCKIDDDHKCNQDDLATALLLAKETKPCPNCRVPIFKIDGCSQMWCTKCHTPFCWDTGMPISGVIHNPHYYEWQRKNQGMAPRRPGTRFNCGGLPELNDLYLTDITRPKEHQLDNAFPFWRKCHRAVVHFERWVLLDYPMPEGIRDHKDLRIRYLLDTLSEKNWIKELKKRQKLSEKCQEVHNVLDLFITSMRDLFQRWLTETFDIQKEAWTLRDYVNTHLMNISERYNNVTPKIELNWGEGRSRKEKKEKKKTTK